jgi:hypothetical protein
MSVPLDNNRADVVISVANERWYARKDALMKASGYFQ